MPRGEAIVSEAAAENHVDIVALTSGLTNAGPDIGTGRSEILSRPRVALLTGAGTGAYNAGEAWHLLSERFRIPVSLLDVDAVEQTSLSRYNTVVMAGGSYSDLPVEKIRAWVNEGGHLIALDDAAEWVVEHGLMELESKSADLDSLIGSVPFGSLSQARGAHRIGGTILQIDLDETHPIGYGYPTSIPVFRRGTSFYDVPTKPGLTVAAYSDDPLLSGYISPPMLDQARGSVAIAADRYGQGRVSLLMDNPNFRAFWYGTNGLFLNAIFFGQAY